MILRYFGHSLFTMTLNSGLIILTDPYGSFCKYPERSLDADIVTISHHHFDHDALETVRGEPLVLDQEGFYQPADAIAITGIPTFHDTQQGLRRGRNIVFAIAAEGLKIVHLGDLGHLPDDTQRAAIGIADILLIPVGGTYTLDAKKAYECVELLKPKIAVPMHYQTRFSKDMGIATEAEFLRLMGVCGEPLMELEISRETVGDYPKLQVMDIQE